MGTGRVTMKRFVTRTLRQIKKWACLSWQMAAFAALFLPAHGVLAQNSRLYTDTLTIRPGDTLALSQGFVVPFSEMLFSPGQPVIDSSRYALDYASGRLWLRVPPPGDTVLYVRYRAFIWPAPAGQIAIRQIKLVRDTTGDLPVDMIFEETAPPGSDIFWETSRIRKSGSLSRGITVGNNRGLSVTSGLRLQLEGDLGDGLKIVGAISDENIPIQPDGTTQQLSEFDKIFIKLMKDNYYVTIGDYEVSHKGSAFANYYRNVQGLQIGYDGPKTRASVSGAVAKGKFHTNSFMGLEGVSGPYRLTGQNGERFFIILAGSERVYLNGRLMQRGETQDYIINYNTAEITFTTRNVITSVMRIVVDFEYNDRYFNRSLVVAKLEQKLWKDRLNIRFSYGRDADNPNAPFDNPNDFAAVRDSLSKAGDNATSATTSGIFDSGFSETDGPRYLRRDTLIGNVLFERYAFSKNPDSAIYKIFFSYVGPNNGHYRRDLSGFNDNIFAWVAPDANGNPSGDYAPVRTWVLPRMLQVADAQVELQLTRRLQLYTETALSREDKNRLSPIGDNDNTGLANRAGLRWEEVRIGDSLTLSLDLSHQYIDARYTNLDRVYQAEYGRKWNFDDQAPRRDEQIGMGKIRLDYKKRLQFEAETGLRNTGPGRNAYRQVYGISSQMPKFLQGNYTFTHIRSQEDSSRRDARWLRHEGDIFAKIGFLRPGVEVWIENREEQRSDTTHTGSFSFVDLKPYLRTVDTRVFQALISWNYRRDREHFAGADRDKSRAQTWYLQMGIRPSQSLNIQSITSYRNFEALDTLFAAQGVSDSKVINTNLQTTYFTKNQLFYTNFVYEVNSEQLAQKEIRFIEVNPGQGQYVWLDSLFNNDGIQDIEEFQLATNPLVANYVRIVVPTRDLVPTTRASLTGNVKFDFTKLFPRSKNVLKETLRNIRILTQLRINQNKARNNSLASYFIDITNPFADSSLLDANYSLRQDLLFFQNSPVGDLKFSFIDNQSKLFLATGDEFRAFKYYRAGQRLSIGKDKSLENELRVGNKSLNAVAFGNRNYDIRFVEENPQINFQFSRKLRLTTGYEYKYRQNTNESSVQDATVNIHKAIFENKWNVKDRNNINTRLELISLSQRGKPGIAAEYELRDGLQPGFNAIWQVFTTYYLLNNVELSLTYDGRVSPRVPVIHTGRVQVRAFF